MSIKPILFNTKMVRAILNGRKTQTRRVVKEFAGEEILSVRSPDGTEIGKYGRDGWRGELPDRHDGNTYCVEARPPCKVGDILWVREAWCKGRVEYGEEPDGRNVPYIEQCTGDDSFIPKEWAFRHDVGTEDVVWQPSIHMPRKAARIFLRVTDVRVERLQEITETDAMTEGCEKWCEGTELEDSARSYFCNLWDSTIKKDDLNKYGWESNPWVWVITFERCEKPVGWLEVL